MFCKEQDTFTCQPQLQDSDSLDIKHRDSLTHVLFRLCEVVYKILKTHNHLTEVHCLTENGVPAVHLKFLQAPKIKLKNSKKICKTVVLINGKKGKDNINSDVLSKQGSQIV